MAQKLPIKKVLPATEVRNNLGTLLNRVYRNEEHLVVEKLGIPVAAIISIKDYEDYDPTPAEVQESSALMRDIIDVPIALAAIKAAVDHFVSEDKDFTAAHKTTANLHRRLHVLLPGTFLREVMGWTGEELEMIRRRTWADLAEE